MRTHRFITGPFVLLTALWAPVVLAADPAVDPTLDALDQRGKTLKEFTADVKLTETDPALGVSTVRLGKLWFQKMGEGDARVRIVFDRKVNGRIAVNTDKIEYLLEDGWFTDRVYGTKKTENRRQIVAPGEKVNLLKLGEGPLPLPIGQSKEDVHKQFDATRAAPSKDDPADSTHLTLKPKPGSSLAKKFTTLDVWVDAKTQMPVRIDTLDAAGTERRQTEMTKVVINTTALKDKDFTLDPIDGTWSRHSEAWNEGAK